MRTTANEKPPPECLERFVARLSGPCLGKSLRFIRERCVLNETKVNETTLVLGENLPIFIQDRDYALPRELTPNLSPLRAAFCESGQISKHNTFAAHFKTYNLV